MPDTVVFARARNSAEPDDSFDPFAAVAKLFDVAFAQLDQIEARLTTIDQRLDAIEAKLAQPAADRIIKHVRNADGAIVKSVLVAAGQ